MPPSADHNSRFDPRSHLSSAHPSCHSLLNYIEESVLALNLFIALLLLLPHMQWIAGYFKVQVFQTTFNFNKFVPITSHGNSTIYED